MYNNIKLMKTFKSTIVAENGIDTIAASKIAELANDFKCDINVLVSENVANVKSIINFMSVGFRNNTKFEMTFNGIDENEAYNAFNALFKKLALI
jgi:phosphocarrier protein